MPLALPQKTFAELFKELADVHRGWCNYCRGMETVCGANRTCTLRECEEAFALPEEGQILTAQHHAIECGNLALELQSALAMLLNACEEARWPLTGEQMAPMNMARAALKKRLEPQSGVSEKP